MRVYEKLRTYLILNNLPYEIVAKASSIPNTKFEQMLNGEQTLYADDLKAICAALNVSADNFIEKPNNRQF